jgi:hypothetical protein
MILFGAAGTMRGCVGAVEVSCNVLMYIVPPSGVYNILIYIVPPGSVLVSVSMTTKVGQDLEVPCSRSVIKYITHIHDRIHLRWIHCRPVPRMGPCYRWITDMGPHDDCAMRH